MQAVATLNFILAFLCAMSVIPSFIVWLVLLINRNKKMMIPMFIMFGMINGFFAFSLIGSLFIPVCEHQWETHLKVEATCTENGSTIQICTLCGREQEGEDIPASGHVWNESIKEATCTEPGEYKKECSVCGEITTETIEASHSYTEAVVSEPKCEVDGEKELTCSVCGNTEYKTVEATGHTWIDATCTAAKTCSICGTTEGKAIGHTTAAGVCSRCQKTVKKQSPVTVVDMRHTIDYVGGVEWSFEIRNNSDKEIKYIIFQWSCYNAVGDLIRDEITGESYKRCKFTGPLAPGETTGRIGNTTKFYNYSYASMKWDEIVVEYMDGTTESVLEYCEGYYE